MAAVREAKLEPKLVGDIVGTFFVPAYQRGYRWGEIEVRRLLDDIWESRDKPYYLQPVVVKRHGDEWELVDGQQRLTTLFLIFKYMKDEGLKNSGANYAMRYETRRESAEYLEELDPDGRERNIDFFHIYEAYRCISRWFEPWGHRRQFVADKLYGALFEYVRVIWYEAPDDLDSTTLFTRLNVGRIPLTDAELVKALLLSERGDRSGTTDRALEIAAQWDTFERDLREPERWAFITGKASSDPTHISLLLDTIAGGPTGRERPLFYTFEELRGQVAEDPQTFWNRVVDLHSLILGWYDSRDLYHKIGFLVSEGAKSFAELIEASRGKPKSSFEAELDSLIRNHLSVSTDDLEDLTFANSKTNSGLLLMNVETIRRQKHSSERYSFREQALGRWSLEHIHARNAESLNRAEQWEVWLRLHRRALEALSNLDPTTKGDLLGRVDAALERRPIRQTDFRPLEHELTDLLSSKGDSNEGDLDSIANLALLAGDDNSVLSNSVFAVKRAAILDLDKRGSYIPVCTRNVFLKYYSPASEQQMHFWSADDRRYYLEEMVSVLRNYLLADEEAS